MEKNELIYIVKLIRADEQVVDLVETTDFNKAKEIWKGAYDLWASAVADRQPFIIDEPANNGYITAFDPSLIREIFIIPMETQQKPSNPYERRMQKQGLSAMLQGGDLMDGGYK